MAFTNSRKTERLVIRPLRKKDYKPWLSGFESRQPAVRKYDPGKIDMSECTKEWFAALVAKHQSLAQEDTAHVFGVFEEKSETHIGMVDFSTLARDQFQWARIGYTIHNQHWRKGFAKEAVEAALEIAFEDLDFHRVEAHININNEPSYRLAESVGMEYECTRKGFIYEGLQWTDHLVYYIQKDPGVVSEMAVTEE
ncbi:GNAT family N-acetyltransferase [Halobacillus litoralis]|uniref:GNAT family N-acetyltransferase n=1 Tax=Halobacillus litoralis TaxID=45668 RepID=UPI001CD7B28A|nr:GNAT family N-acetyltransferase [Halobacillus litoralis]MCA0970215.1 GNAT family N-acetyltransferase [Halobacillus litoralis]